MANLPDGIFGGYCDVQSRLYILENNVNSAEQCQEILDTYVHLQATVRNAVERKLRKLQNAKSPRLTPAALPELAAPTDELLFAVYNPAGKRISMLCTTPEEAIEDTLFQLVDVTWKDLLVRRHRCLPVKASPEAIS